MKSFAAYKSMADAFLQQAVSVPAGEEGGLAESMRYSLLAGGKRIRPVLALAFCDALGGDIEKALPAACALEMIHTYSLIHDDLPCMDNDVLRRGKPTNHVVYGECTATLAGDALQSLAFETLASAPLESGRIVRCLKILSEAAGYRGMCQGQFLDMEGEGKSLTAEELTHINNLKTGALLSGACRMGAAAAGADEKQLEAAGTFGSLLGLAFQIRDDVLDVISTDAELGKSVGSDVQEHKNTYMALLGMEGCNREISRLTASAVAVLEENFTDTAFLSDLARSLAERVN